jgi:hypothetical protein
MVRKYGPRDTPDLSSVELYNDLQIGGDDAYEMLTEVSKKYGITFTELNFHDYFPYETEAAWFYFKSLLGLRYKRKSFNFGHLNAVVERGRWFDPE